MSSIKHPEVSAMRITYQDGILTENEIKSNPFDQFENWFNEAKSVLPADHEVNAMCLSTASKEGRPSSRMVLLKDFSSNGFVFYTNYNSRKSLEMDSNPFAALNFYWSHGTWSRCIRIEGSVEKLSTEESTTYFHSRPRESQIGAWTSEHQSGPVQSRQFLETREEQLKVKFGDAVIPKPEFWGGYRVKPDKFEFWQGRPSRLHDRIEYVLASRLNEWAINRLSP